MRKYSSITRESSRRTSYKKRIKLLVVVGLFCIVLLLVVPRVLGFASSLIFAPIAHFETWFYTSGATVPSYFMDRAALVEKINSLERQLSVDHGTANSINRLQEENVTLRNMLGEDETPRIAASVIGRPTVTPYDVLVLDKGAEDGILQYAPVYVGIDQAIGYIAEVYSDTSIVTLVTTPGFESTVYILGPNIYTTAFGTGGGVLQVSVPQGIPLAVGDLVVVPSFDSGVYGTIDVIDSVPTEPEQKGYVTYDVPIQSLRFVSVGTTPLKSQTFDEAVGVVERIKTDLTKVPVPFGVLVDTSTPASSTATTTQTLPQSTSTTP